MENIAQNVFLFGVILVLIFPHYSVSLPIQSKCRKTRTRITPNIDIFHAEKTLLVQLDSAFVSELTIVLSKRIVRIFIVRLFLCKREKYQQ